MPHTSPSSVSKSEQAKNKLYYAREGNEKSKTPCCPLNGFSKNFVHVATITTYTQFHQCVCTLRAESKKNHMIPKPVKTPLKSPLRILACWMFKILLYRLSRWNCNKREHNRDNLLLYSNIFPKEDKLEIPKKKRNEISFCKWNLYIL